MRIHRYASLIIVYLLLTFSPFSQENKTPKEYRQLYNHAEKLYHSSAATESTDSAALIAYGQVISLLIKDKKYTDTLVDSYLKSGILQMSGNKSEQALGNFYHAIVITMNNKRLSDSLLFQPYLYAGTVHYSLNNLDSAVYYYKKAEEIISICPGLKESERLFNKFGALYFETGDYNKSISYFEKALSMIDQKSRFNLYFKINYENNIATALMKQGKNEEALEIFRDLVQYKDLGDALFYNMGNTYFEKSDYANAIKYVRQIKNLEYEKFICLTKIFIQLKLFDSAGIYLEKAKNLFNDKKNYSPTVTRGIILKYAGDLKAAAGKNAEALKEYQYAIISLNPTFTDTAIAANPSSFSGLQNFLFLFDALIAKASLLNELSRNPESGNYLKESIRAYGAALSLAKHIEKTYFSDDARLFLKTKVNPATQQAVEVALRLYNKTKDPQFINSAFAFEENNKATVLQAGLKNLELSSLPELPANLVSEEKKYRTLLARLNIQASLLNDSISQTALQGEIHDIEIALSGVQDKLDENPLYHELKFYSATVNMDSLKEKMEGNDEAILSYYYTTSSLLCFYITKEGSGFSSIPLSDTLFSTILSLRRELQSPQASGRKNLKFAGSSLFQELIAPVYERIKDKKRLLVIPFNEISYVPFEMLVNTSAGSLLVKNFAISYNYAAGFLTDKKVERIADYNVFAMAPFSDIGNEDLILPALPSSIEEISGLPGKKLSGSKAIKDQFISLSGQYPVIHLATHAIANDTNLLGSYIEFYGLKKDADTTHRLYEQEIYTLDLKSARLVILSACETGNGLLVNGEGIISLSRAFSYAGCKSVITSLWKADEISTSFICKRLHYYLQKGFAIDHALQQSKVDYLETSEVEDRYKNPAYWAHLVLIGDFLPIVNTRFNWNVLWIGIASGALLIFLILMKKNQA
jgi:CHAT domain-containing protein/Tfp pilus assembly protein PilF